MADSGSYSVYKLQNSISPLYLECQNVLESRVPGDQLNMLLFEPDDPCFETSASVGGTARRKTLSPPPREGLPLAPALGCWPRALRSRLLSLMLTKVLLMMPGGLMIARPSVTILAGMEVSKETLLPLPLAIRLLIQQTPRN